MAKLTADQASAKLLAKGASPDQLKAAQAKGINLVGLLAWVEKYGPMEVEAIQALIAVLAGA